MLDVTQAEFADKLGVSRSFLSQVERGEKQPSRRMVDGLFVHYKIHPDYVLRDIKEPFPSLAPFIHACIRLRHDEEETARIASGLDEKKWAALLTGMWAPADKHLFALADHLKVPRKWLQALAQKDAEYLSNQLDRSPRVDDVAEKGGTITPQIIEAAQKAAAGDPAQAQRLTALREVFGWSVAELARKSKLAPQAIQSYEGAHETPGADAVKALALAYGLDEYYLYDYLDGALGQGIAHGLPLYVDGLAVGCRIWLLRDGRKVERLAQKAGVEFEHWLWYEAGVGPPSKEPLEKIARCLGVKTDDLLKGRPPGPALSVLLGGRSGGTKLPNHRSTTGLIKLPPHDVTPIDDNEGQILSEALEVIRAKETQYAGALEANVHAFHAAVRSERARRSEADTQQGATPKPDGRRPRPTRKPAAGTPGRTARA